MSTSTPNKPGGSSQAVSFLTSLCVLLYFFGRAFVQRFPSDIQYTVSNVLEWILIVAMVGAGVHLAFGLIRWLSSRRERGLHDPSA